MKLLPELEPGEKELAVAFVGRTRPVDPSRPPGPNTVGGRFLAEAGKGMVLVATRRRWCFTRRYSYGKIFWSCPRNQVLAVELTGRTPFLVRFTIRFADGSAVSVKARKYQFLLLQGTIHR